jgi:hypothetical protein
MKDQLQIILQVGFDIFNEIQKMIFVRVDEDEIINISAVIFDA